MGGRSSEHEISVASARSVVEGLREAGYHPVPIEISREGRWALPAASPAEVGAGYIRPLHGGEADICRRSPDSPRRCRSRAVRSRGRRLSRPARAVRRGRHRAGPARARRRRLRRPGRRRLGGRDGQGPLQGGHARQRHPGDAEASPCSRERATGSSSPFGYPVVVKPARLGSSVGITIVRTAEELARGSRAGVRARREGARRGVRVGGRGRVQRARKRGAARLPGRRDRAAAGRLVRLRLEVRRGWHGPRRARPHHRPSRPPARRSSPFARSSPATARGWPGSTCSSARTARCSSTS